jgi:hypothetical protein
MYDPNWKLKPIEGFRFPRKRRLFLDHHMKHGGADGLLGRIDI